ncbi:MAG: SDR family NAD(P)-dependent oxidoreductase [Acidimicrobiia bacterium]|nr:SDR family NAD(P)-dependent oxidoreductase [Acidimicrobiia bacterium]
MSRDVALPGSVVLVTGAGSGIGRATALAFAGAGARVLSVDIDRAAAEKTAAECAERGVESVGYQVDVADCIAVAALADTVHSEHGPLDILVNNAGVGMSARFLDMTLEDWDWIVSINLMGAIYMCKAFGPSMVDRGRGHVVNISSGLGYTPTATEPGYGTTKAAVLAFSRSLRADWQGRGVGVSAICPGVINTPIISHTRFRGDQAAPDRVERVTHLFSKRGHPPEVVAAAVLAAVRENKSVVPVGAESRAGWYISRWAPTRVTDWMARIAGRRI